MLKALNTPIAGSRTLGSSSSMHGMPRRVEPPSKRALELKGLVERTACGASISKTPGLKKPLKFKQKQSSTVVDRGSAKFCMIGFTSNQKTAFDWFAAVIS